METKTYQKAISKIGACTLFFAAFLSLPSLAQQRVQAGETVPAPKKDIRVQNYYRRTLGLDSAKAVQMEQVQREYKEGVRSLVADTSLSSEGRRSRLNLLQKAKNDRLRKFLSPEQQDRAIPTSERNAIRP